MATVQLNQVRKSYGATEIIKGVDLTIYDQQLTVFVGPSGCGKSTLLRVIAGLEDITSGDLLIDGRRVNDVPPAKRGLALVFQSYALYPHMNVAENMSFSMRLAGVPKAEREEKVLEAARILNLENLLDRKAKELSGGQRQRVAIGRAIVRNPQVFLFDEPLSNLDAALRVRMRLELAKLHRQLHATMIYVTHDQVEAMTMADRIVVMRSGIVEQVGSPMELYRSPRNLFVAGFIGSPRMNFVAGKVARAGEQRTVLLLDEDTAGEAVSLELPAMPALSAGEPVTIGTRPEHVTLTAVGGLSGVVQAVEHLGGESYVYVRMRSGEPLTVRVDGYTELAPENPVRVSLKRNLLHVFNQHGEAVRSMTEAAAQGALP